MKLLKKTKIHRWADGAVIYQIYPRSYQDSNGDGIGDLPGIISRLDYLQDLGVTGIWLSPFYPSPMADFGYDVSDYCDVDPTFGNLKDFERLVSEAKTRNIKILIDIVPNHTSDEHPWFKSSRQSKQGEYSDWYIWKDPKGYEDGQPMPPNNWRDIFSGQSAWQWVPERQQFYLHTFLAEQPDLNWQNEKVREAIKDVLRFWLDMGVDGFRVDAVAHMGKDPEYRDNQINHDYVEGEQHPMFAVHREFSEHWPSHLTYLQILSGVLKEKRFTAKPRFMVTEAYTKGIDRVKEYLSYYKKMDPAVAAPFIFEGTTLPWEAQPWQQFLTDFHAALEKHSRLALSSYAFSNHDQPRLVSRLGEEKARAAMVMQLTLPGMIFMYYGEEIGMHNVDVPPAKRQDPGANPDGQTRDPQRTPMQWSKLKNAGFSKAKETWLPIASDFKDFNVDVESSAPDSFLSLNRQLLALRRSSTALRQGTMRVEQRADSLLAYTRQHGRDSYTTVINFSDQPAAYTFGKDGQVLLSSRGPRADMVHAGDAVTLAPHEAIIIGKTH